jgi:hypothetical protein
MFATCPLQAHPPLPGRGQRIFNAFIFVFVFFTNRLTHFQRIFNAFSMHFIEFHNFLVEDGCYVGELRNQPKSQNALKNHGISTIAW